MHRVLANKTMNTTRQINDKGDMVSKKKEELEKLPFSSRTPRVTQRAKTQLSTTPKTKTIVTTSSIRTKSKHASTNYTDPRQQARDLMVEGIHCTATNQKHDIINQLGNLLLQQINQTEIYQNDVQRLETKNRELSIFTAVCRDQFKQEDFISTEMSIIGALNGCIEYPTPQTFVRALLIDIDSIDCEEMCNFFLDVSLTVNDFEELPAHFVSAAAIVIGTAACNKICPILKLMALINCSCKTSLIKAAQALLDVANTVVNKNLGGIFTYYAKDSPDRLTTAIQKASNFLQESDN